MIKIDQTGLLLGRSAKDRRREADKPGLDGAVAALETFYHGFNSRLPEVVADIWGDDAQVQLNNPLGGVLRGLDKIKQLYGRVLSGPANVWVEFFDVLAYATDDVVVFAGRERGQCEFNGEVLALHIRTSRVFCYLQGVGWRQVHHHGSIEQPDLLGRYQRLIEKANSTRREGTNS